jgi:flagellar basal-body rod protein FlgB
MSEIYLDQLGSTQAKWLSVRQSLIASNVANANIPGYKSQDVRPMTEKPVMFSNLLKTHDAHLTSGVGHAQGIGIDKASTWETYHSGANVSLPQEMMKAGETASSFQLNTAIKTSFHTMLITVFGS